MAPAVVVAKASAIKAPVIIARMVKSFLWDEREEGQAVQTAPRRSSRRLALWVARGKVSGGRTTTRAPTPVTAFR
ncbi:unnamed protein product [Pararhodospirillum photometricum DSM 122]|uniref:Uncharacterized protein n=1 Tax=Pararhodospirillum photometricum DSM 122 TaxID=1150469 RepID=H6SPT0_PARPM|nr:unnamed protein product [Pararhodospirillum photometricum DSM 122]